ESSPLVMELPAYHWPSPWSLIRNAWHRLKNFIFRAGKVIVPVCMLIGALNAVTLKGENPSLHKDSILSQIGHTIPPVLAPMGIEQDNWPAAVGLLTGVLAKEVVIGTLNTLYSQTAGLVANEEDTFNLKKGLQQAFASVPQNLAGLSAAFSNPFRAS